MHVWFYLFRNYPLSYMLTCYRYLLYTLRYRPYLHHSILHCILGNAANINQAKHVINAFVCVEALPSHYHSVGNSCTGTVDMPSKHEPCGCDFYFRLCCDNGISAWQMRQDNNEAVQILRNVVCDTPVLHSQATRT